MDNYDLITEINEKNKQLTMCVQELRKSGTAYAQAEKDYKVLLRQEILKLRDEKVAVGIIEKIAYGIPSVAEARFKRDVALTVYEANQEAINSLKLQIRLLDNQVEREWKQ